MNRASSVSVRPASRRRAPVAGDRERSARRPGRSRRAGGARQSDRGRTGAPPRGSPRRRGPRRRPPRRLRPAAAPPAADRRAGSRAIRSRRAIRASPPSTCRHARTACHGASTGTCSRATPCVRTSPSGTPSGRVKNPPTIASRHPVTGAPRREPFARQHNADLGAVGVVAGDVDRGLGASVEQEAPASRLAVGNEGRGGHALSINADRSTLVNLLLPGKNRLVNDFP